VELVHKDNGASRVRLVCLEWVERLELMEPLVLLDKLDPVAMLELLESQDLRVVLASRGKLEELGQLVTLEAQGWSAVKVLLDQKAMRAILEHLVKLGSRDKLE
jgi:hypothetical protein